MREIETTFDEVRAALHREGIGLRVEGATAVLDIAGRSERRSWRWVTSGRRPRFDEPPGDDGPSPTLLLGPTITGAVAEQARARGDWYADERGNVFVHAPGIRIDIRRERPPASRAPGAPDRTPATNLLSARRAQVIFCLLSWPQLIHAPIRYLAQSAGVSVSVAHSTQKALADERYLIAGARTLDRRGELLDRWVAAFPLGLGRALEVGRYVGDPTSHAWVAAGHRVFVSGEQAACTLHGPGLTLYVPELDRRAVVRSRWRRRQDGEVENIVLRRSFWSTPWQLEATADHALTDPRSTLAPDVLVLADLVASRDPRQLEVAQQLREEFDEPRDR